MTPKISAATLAAKMRREPGIMQILDTAAVREQFAECLEQPGVMSGMRAIAIMRVVLQEHYLKAIAESLDQAQASLKKKEGEIP